MSSPHRLNRLFLYRGNHVLTLDFEEAGHLPISSDKTVVVWADVNVKIDSTNSYVVRGDGIEHRIELSGTVTEIGGQGVSIDNAELILGSGLNCESGATDARCINIESIIWNGGTFTLIATAPTWMQAGQTQLNLESTSNSSLYLRSGNAWSDSMSIRIELKTPFDVDIEPIIENEQEVVSGEITLLRKTQNSELKELLSQFT